MTNVLGSDLQDSHSKKTIANLYRYSDLSVEAIAHQVDMDTNEVGKIVDEIVKNDALEVLVDQSTTSIEKIMTPVVVTLDCLKTPRDAAVLMAENEIGSVIVTKNGRPMAIVTHSDITRWSGLRPKLLDARLEDSASRPLISVGRGTSVEEAARVMITNRIHKLAVVDEDQLLGIVTITDLALFLAPSKRPGLALSVLQAISRATQKQAH